MGAYIRIARTEVLIAVGIEWYREGRISQGQGALIAKMSRAEFLDELFRAKVPACQVTVDELTEEVDRAVEANRHVSLLILLAKAGQLELLQLGGVDVNVPETVVAEIEAGTGYDSTADGIRQWAGCRSRRAGRCPAPVRACRLDPGETAVLALADGDSQAEVVLDDLAARRCARRGCKSRVSAHLVSC